MSPPTTKPRLTTLDASEVARETVQRALATIRRQVDASLAPAYALTAKTDAAPDELVRKTRLYKTVKRLAEYAQRGGELGQPVRDALQSILPVLQQQLKHGAKASITEPREDVEPVDALIERIDTLRDDEPLAVVVRGAHAREVLDQTDDPLTAWQLAILSGRAQQTISRLILQGRLGGQKRDEDSAQRRENPYLVAQPYSRAFLLECGVEGIEATPRRKRPQR